MPADQSPNISAAAESRDVYLKAAAVALASFGRWNPAWRRVLAMPVEPEGDWPEVFRKVGASIEVVEFEHSAPRGFAPRFAGALFLLDVVQRFALDDYTLIIDPDVLCVGDVSAIAAQTDVISVLPIAYDLDHDVNGLSRAGAARIHGDLGESRQIVTHFGGEFYGLPPALRASLADRAQRAWLHSLDMFGKGRSFLTTEEHIMGFAVAGLPHQDASHLIRRVWTAHRFRTVNGKESDLALWHLPAEKEGAFAAIYPELAVPEGWFWRSDRAEFVEKAGRLAGFHHRSVGRLTKDALAQMRERFRR